MAEDKGRKPDLRDAVDEDAAAEKLKEKGIEGGHLDVEKFPQSVMTTSGTDRRNSTGDPTMGANADEYADSDVFTETDDDAHREAQDRARAWKEGTANGPEQPSNGGSKSKQKSTARS